MILDGWGISNSVHGNAVAAARTPETDKLSLHYPYMTLQASGIGVGLPWNEPGNSEVGHITIGSGFIVYQNLPRINMAIQNGSFYQNKVLLSAIDHAAESGKKLHLIGLVSDGSVHSHIDHLHALLEMAAEKGLHHVYVHMITDGRDTLPSKGVAFAELLMQRMKELNVGRIATIAGRYYTMDRNNNWDRIAAGYNCMVKGQGPTGTNPLDVIRGSYEKEVTDEFIEPTVILNDDNQPTGLIEEGDSVICFNFREDRMRQIVKAFTADEFKEFERGEKIKNLYIVSMIEYEKGLALPVAFIPQLVENPLGKILSDNELAQLRIAETEKYAHVTYFFNGGNEKEYLKEDRIMVPSPDVKTYDLKPEMSAYEVERRLTEKIDSGAYDFIAVNFANADMVGHTGNFEAAVQAVECVDSCVGRVVKAVLKQNGILLITADHGNCETMIDERTGEILTDHTNNPVPFWLVGHDFFTNKSVEEVSISQSRIGGMLVDLSPTILSLLGIAKPREMTGISLLEML